MDFNEIDFPDIGITAVIATSIFFVRIFHFSGQHESYVHAQHAQVS